MNFNGYNAYVSFGDINQVDSLAKLTASAWIRSSGLQDWASIIGKANDVVNEWEIIESGAGFKAPNKACSVSPASAATRRRIRSQSATGCFASWCSTVLKPIIPRG